MILETCLKFEANLRYETHLPILQETNWIVAGVRLLNKEVGAEVGACMS